MSTSTASRGSVQVRNTLTISPRTHRVTPQELQARQLAVASREISSLQGDVDRYKQQTASLANELTSAAGQFRHAFPQTRDTLLRTQHTVRRTDERAVLTEWLQLGSLSSRRSASIMGSFVPRYRDSGVVFA